VKCESRKRKFLVIEAILWQDMKDNAREKLGCRERRAKVKCG
jgi:hypothetical protein